MVRNKRKDRLRTRLISFVHWRDKFANAIRGLWVGSRGQTSFVFHFVATFLVCSAAWYLECVLLEWCLILLCIGLVLSLEMMNSALEKLAEGLCDHENPDVRDALDIASAAVLVGSLVSVLVGLAVLGTRLWNVS
ncbi:MAG: diacylglycerol kinase [Aureliella sp.]